MARLTTRARKALPQSDFAGPGRSYPDENKAHARDALSRVSANGSPAVKAEVREKVEKKYPGMVHKGGKGEGRGKVPTGGHHQANHREPRDHDEFGKLGNDGDY